VLRLSTPPLAPKLTDDVTVYLVLNDFGPLGRAYVETDEANATERDVVSNISRGDYSKPIRVVAFNTAEGWSRDVTEDIAEALLERDASEGDLSESAETFVGRVLDHCDLVVFKLMRLRQ
jgi:hypothetical protein